MSSVDELAVDRVGEAVLDLGAARGGIDHHGHPHAPPEIVAICAGNVT